jgi:hypothetical protein
MMHVSASLQVNLKDRPQEYRGITQEHWVIGKDAEVSLSGMIVAFVHSIEQMYGVCYSVETLNNELMDASKLLWNMRFEEK